MEYRQLKYILTVARCGSITTAAEQLFISQPALSSFITKAERNLKVKLFDRATTPLTLTYAGEKYVKTADRIVSAYERMIKQLGDIASNREGVIRVGLPWGLLSYIVPELQNRYQSENPSVEIKIVPGSRKELYSALLQRGADFIVTHLPMPDKDCQCIELAREQVFAAAKKGYLKDIYDTEWERFGLPLRCIADKPLLMLPHSSSFRYAVDDIFAKNEITPSNIVEAPSPGSMVRIAAAGGGVTLVTHSILSTVRTEEKMELFRIAGDASTVAVYAVALKEAYITGLEKDCMDVIKSLISKE